jgi:polyisoprenoid-binding protein YceI
MRLPSPLSLAAATALAVLAAVPAVSRTTVDVPAGDYRLDADHASLTWRVNHLGLSSYTARFTRLDARLTYDPREPTKSRLTATVDPRSVRTDFPRAAEKDFDKELAEDANFFHTDRFAEVRFVSRRIVQTGPATGRMTGDLTLLGVTRPVTLDVAFNGSLREHPASKLPALGFSASGVVKRSEFGMTHLIPFVGDEVSLQIEAEFLKS